jgi:hypothetical protein
MNKIENMKAPPMPKCKPPAADDEMTQLVIRHAVRSSNTAIKQRGRFFQEYNELLEDNAKLIELLEDNAKLISQLDEVRGLPEKWSHNLVSALDGSFWGAIDMCSDDINKALEKDE